MGIYTILGKYCGQCAAKKFHLMCSDIENILTYAERIQADVKKFYDKSILTANDSDTINSFLIKLKNFILLSYNLFQCLNEGKIETQILKQDKLQLMKYAKMLLGCSAETNIDILNFIKRIPGISKKLTESIIELKNFCSKFL